MTRISIAHSIRWLLVPVVVAACAGGRDASAAPDAARATLARALAALERSEGARLEVAIDHRERGTLVWAYGRASDMGPLDVRGEEPCEAWVSTGEAALVSTADVPRVAWYAVAGREYVRVRSEEASSGPVTGVKVNRPYAAMDFVPRQGMRIGGWWRAPEETALTADLRRLFDRGPLVKWLTSVPEWQTSALDSGGHRLYAVAVPPEFASWGGVHRIEVTAEVRDPDVLVSLEVRVRRGPPEESGNPLRERSRRGPPAEAFPFAPLLTDIPKARQPKPVLDVAVESGYVETAYRLRSLPPGPRPVLEGFLRRRRAESADAAPR